MADNTTNGSGAATSRSDSNAGCGDDRKWVTYIVLLGSFFGLIGLSFVIIYYSSDSSNAPTERSKNARELFTALLPVFGTWVGTLLAFYFSRDNFAAANKSVSDMVDKISGADERLRQIPVRSKILALNDMVTMVIKPGDEATAKISDILVKFERYDRIPILDDKGCLFYLVYKSILYQYISQIALGTVTLAGGKRQDEATFKDLLDSPMKIKELDIKTVFKKSFGFVAENATLADAKQAMENVSKTVPCNDVFVTKTGRLDEPIIGWVTDNTITENLKV